MTKGLSNEKQMKSTENKFAMACQLCGEEKLFKEFVFNNLSEECMHEPLFCMQCALKAKETGKCPYTDCYAKVPATTEDLTMYEAVLDSMYPQFTAVSASDLESQLPDDEYQTSIVNIVQLTGERHQIPATPQTTVSDLKKEIYKRQGTETEKQKLIFDDQELEIRTNTGSQATLQDYNIKSNCTICLLVMLYSIPEEFNHVVFDLNWGYPRSGRDYLDACCLVFRGTQHVGTIDYNRNKKFKITHSGDVMNDQRKRGHHTIEVSLKGIPRFVTHLFFVLSAYNSPNLKHFRNPNLRFYDASDRDTNLCSTSFSHALNSQAVVMCSMSRKDGVWQIFRSGQPSAGNVNNYGQLVRTVRKLVKQGV